MPVDPPSTLRPEPLSALLETHPEVVEVAAFPADEEALAALEEALGYALPADLRDFYGVSDGATLHSPTQVAHLASVEELAAWVAEGLVDALEAVPIANDTGGGLLVCDARGDWGGSPGAIYRLRAGRTAGYWPVHDAVRVAGSLRELLDHLVAGREPW